MDLQYIPKTFWHSLSISVLIVTTGLTVIAYRSSSVSIETANAKIELSSEVATSTMALNDALVQAKDAKADAEKKYQELQEKYNALQDQLSKVQITASSDEALKRVIKQLSASKPQAPVLKFEKFDKNIQSAEESLKRLQSLHTKIRSRE